MTARSSISRTDLAIVAGLVIAAFAIFTPLFKPMMIYGHSASMDAFRQVVFHAAAASGDWFPRFTPELYFGYGSPIFHYYGPLPYMMTEIFVAAGAGIVLALKLTLVASAALSAIFFYVFARLFLSRAASAAGALAYMLAPYHLVDMLVRHAFGEHVAFAWIPLAAFGVVGCVRRPGAGRFIAGAIGVALLPLAHNITALLAMPVLAFLWAVEVVRAFRERKSADDATPPARRAIAGAGVVAAGLALSAFFWLPAFVEKDDVYARESLTEDFFRYENHFVYTHQLVRPTWGFGGSRADWKDDQMSFQIGLAHLFLAAIALASVAGAIARRKRDPAGAGAVLSSPATKFLGPALMVFAGAAFMTTPASWPVWRAVPLLEFAQFPWRVLVIVAFGASAVAACAIDLATAADAPSKTMPRVVVAIGAMAVTLAAYFPYTRPMFNIFDRAENWQLPGEYATQRARLAAEPERYMEIDELLDPRFIRQSGEIATSRDDYLPRVVTQKPGQPAEEAAIADGGVVIDAIPEDRNAWRFKVSMDRPGRVIVSQFAFAGWRATIDGAPAAISAQEATGRIVVEVPEGSHAVRVWFGSTPLRTAANAISLAALALLAAGVAISYRFGGSVPLRQRQ